MQFKSTLHRCKHTTHKKKLTFCPLSCVQCTLLSFLLITTTFINPLKKEHKKKYLVVVEVINFD